MQRFEKWHKYIRERRISSLNASNMNPEKVGVKWITRFLGRHPELSSIMSNKIDAGRIKGTSPERLSKWFSDLERIIQEYNILLDNWMKAVFRLGK